MKKLIISSMLLMSFAAAASLETVVSQVSYTSGPVDGETAANIKKALVTEMKSKFFECELRQNDGRQPMSSQRAQSEVIQILSDSATTISLSENEAQPAIMAKHAWKASANMLTTIDVTTSADYKTVKGLYLEAAKLVEKEVNVGTIVNPKFEIQITKEKTVWGNCLLK